MTFRLDVVEVLAAGGAWVLADGSPIAPRVIWHIRVAGARIADRLAGEAIRRQQETADGDDG